MTPFRRILQFCLLAMVSGAPAAPHRPIIHAHPTLTINGMAEDAQGNLWLATSQGL
ncbi:MAG: hypothetical protein JNK87_09545 [Bryobacterales bacterium]|nr:hypothetical protein [Bryobacterales bacterium]